MGLFIIFSQVMLGVSYFLSVLITLDLGQTGFTLVVFIIILNSSSFGLFGSHAVITDIFHNFWSNLIISNVIRCRLFSVYIGSIFGLL